MRDDALSSNIWLIVIFMNWGKCKKLAGQVKSVKSDEFYNKGEWQLKLIIDI